MKKVFLLLSAFAILFPMTLVLLSSFYTHYRYPLLFPESFTLKFWGKTIFHNPQFYTSLSSSLVVGILNGVLATLVSMLTARALVTYNFFGKRFLNVIFSLPLFIPAIALFMGVHLMMIKFQLANSMMGVVLAHMLISIPYGTNIFISLYQGINPDMENVARTLGCKEARLYFKVLLPLLAPGIYLSFSIGFLISFSEYFSTFLIGGGSVQTLAFMLYPYIANGDTGNGAALGVVFILVNILVFFIAEYLSRKINKTNTYLFE